MAQKSGQKIRDAFSVRFLVVCWAYATHMDEMRAHQRQDPATPSERLRATLTDREIAEASLILARLLRAGADVLARERREAPSRDATEG